jgi:hypothetical protein
MKALILAATFWASVAGVWGQDVLATIKQEAQKCGKAILASDYDAVIRHTHPRIVKGLGGREAMIGILKRGVSQMRADGTEFVDVTVGAPTPPKRIGGWVTSIVPQQIVLKVQGGKLYQDSSLLAISEDDEKHWVFVDLGPITKEQLDQAFPELDGKIMPPEKKAPVFKKK